MKISPSALFVPVLVAATSALAPTLVMAADPSGRAAARQAAAVGQTAKPETALPAPIIDDAAMALLLKSQQTMLSLKTYSADDRLDFKYGPTADGKQRPPTATLTTVTFSRPNLLRMDRYELKANDSGALDKKTDSVSFTMVSDGNDIWMQSGTNYRKNPLKSPAQLTSFSGPWSGFFTEQSSPYGQIAAAQKSATLVEVRSLGTESFGGVACQKVLVHQKHTAAPLEYDDEMTFFVGPDNLIRRTVQAFSAKTINYTVERTLSNIKTDAPVANSAALFAYTPPAGITLFVPKPQPVLLANGVAAPDFTAVDSTGASVKLSDFRGKVVVIDFWASWCPPCKASMPHNQEVTKKLQAANVPMVLLAVDNSEDQPAFAKWVQEHPELASLRFVYTDPKKHSVCNDDYHVSGIPTQYVIDPDGIIRASFVGYGGPTDDMENAVKAAVVKTASK